MKSMRPSADTAGVATSLAAGQGEGPGDRCRQQCLDRLPEWPQRPPCATTAGARNFRFLRRRGITVRKTIALLIGTWCIENRASLLHNDSDFHPMTRYLGLREFIGRER